MRDEKEVEELKERRRSWEQLDVNNHITCQCLCPTFKMSISTLPNCQFQFFFRFFFNSVLLTSINRIEVLFILRWKNLTLCNK